MIDQFKHKKIGVICGGYSRERAISMQSGQNIHNALVQLGYHSTIIDFAEENAINTMCDIAFIALHGSDGEDGSLQLVLNQKKMAYTGSDVEASLISNNKILTKVWCEENAIPVPKYQRISTILRELPDSFSYPVIVKPIQEGSSIDVYIIDNEVQLLDKTKELVEKYAQFLLEEYIEGKEVTIGIIDNPLPQLLPILELRPKNRFYDFEAKYTKGLTEFVLPAEISLSEKQLIHNYADCIYRKINAKGMARVDFLICPKKGPLLLEVNTVPGMTETSDLPAQAKEVNIEFNELVEIILKSALFRIK